MSNRTEACGRCSVTTVLDAVEDEDEGDDAGLDPFDGARIEVPDAALRRAAFVGVWLGRLKRRLDGAAFALSYGGDADR